VQAQQLRAGADVQAYQLHETDVQAQHLLAGADVHAGQA
jgi:hypothetical protein